MAGKKFHLGPEETRVFLTWALKTLNIDVVLTYIDVPRELTKQAEKVEEAMYSEIVNAAAQVINKYVGVSEAKFYNVVDRLRVKNAALLATILNNGVGMALDLTHVDDRYVFRRACKEGALWTPCQEI